MRLLTLSALFLAALISGCGSSPLSPTGLAVYDTLETEVHLRTWVNACQKQSPELNRLALLTYQNWWQRNGSYVESADFGLAYDLVKVSENRVETGARIAMGATWNMVQAAENDVQKRLVESKADKVCQDVLSQYDRGDFDFGKKNKWHQELVELQQLRQQQGADLAMQKAVIATNTGKEYGRSFYVIEKLAQRHGCSGADVRLLKNDWPNEVYDARCPDKSYLLLQCEWSNCRISQ